MEEGIVAVVWNGCRRIGDGLLGEADTAEESPAVGHQAEKASRQDKGELSTVVMSRLLPIFLLNVPVDGFTCSGI